jgi:hypothetical protein
MNGYLKIIFIAFIFLVISMINEKFNRDYLSDFLYDENEIPKIIYIYILRYYHYLIFLFSSYYLLFFNGIGKQLDRNIYFIVLSIIVLGWYIFDSCWISYLELYLYGVKDIESIETTFNPSFYPLFYKSVDFFTTLSGILFVVTLSILLYYSKSIPIFHRTIFYIIFLVFFLHGIIKGRMNKNYYCHENFRIPLNI